MALIKTSEHLRIPFQDIEIATKNFNTTLIIGRGGFGNVYKGELLLFDGKLTTVAVKRLNANISGQGFKEFLTEIHLLSQYKHPNLVSLLGFCDEGNEKILVYEHAEHGSLDKFLTLDTTACQLTCKQKIDICIDAASGLDYLHNKIAGNKRVIHRDIKSANILLDHNWKAMISDLGLSKIGRANERETFLITYPCGTDGYCDPVYRDTGVLTKESDVYSFGVVLFEVLCGRLCFKNVNNEHRFLDSLARRYYEEGKVHEIIDPAMKEQLPSGSWNKISEIAYKCLHNAREKRPSMGWVVKELKQALEVQVFIKDQVASTYLSPKVLEVPVLDPAKTMKRPAGILNVKVIKAELRWASDFFAMLKLTDDKLPYKKTTVTHKTMNPEWNEEFNLVVKDLEVQVLEIMLFSWESVGKQENIGMTLVGLEYLNLEEPETLVVELWENPDPTDPEDEKFHRQMVVGNIMVELVYKPFGEEVSATRKATVGTPEGGGLLVVIVHEGKDLEGKHHTNPSVRILFNGEEKNTKHITENCNPRWEEAFVFTLEEQPTNEKIHLEVISTSKMMGLIYPKESLGYIDICLADVVENKRINEKYYLIDSKNGWLQLEMQWSASG